MKILVTGRTGQVARALVEQAQGHPALDLVALGRPELDLERPETIAEAIRGVQPDVVINAAAYTAVDQAEDEPEGAFRVNATGAGEVARLAHEAGAAIIQLSTDYVFDGQLTRPYREDDPVNPLGIYGRSKWEGEEQVRAGNPRHLILRTAWIYSPWERNFVRTMLRVAGERDEVAVVSDQRGSPTSALDLAEAILKILQANNFAGATYHSTARGSCSWADFAEEIFRVSGASGGPSARVRRIATADYPTKARRPAYSVLDPSKFERDFGFALPEWRESVGDVVARLAAQR